VQLFLSAEFIIELIAGLALRATDAERRLLRWLRIG
jgi:hypothetical protein